MSYTPDVFADDAAGNTPITAAKLNKLGTGVATADAAASAAAAAAATKADAAATTAALAAKADAAATATALAGKADAAATTAALAAKADTTALTSGLASKADTTALAASQLTVGAVSTATSGTLVVGQMTQANPASAASWALPASATDGQRTGIKNLAGSTGPAVAGVVVTVTGNINGTASSSLPLRYADQAKVFTYSAGQGSWIATSGDVSVPTLPFVKTVGGVAPDSAGNVAASGTSGVTATVNGTAASSLAITDAAVADILAAGGARRVPTWLASTAYLAGELVVNGTTIYQRKTDGTSAASFDSTQWNALGSTGGGTALTVQDEGSALATAADTLNFVGANVTASGTGSTKTITVSASLGTSYGTLGTDLNPIPTTLTDVAASSVTFTLAVDTVFIITWGANLQSNSAATIPKLYLNVDGTNESVPAQLTGPSSVVVSSVSRMVKRTLTAGTHTIKLQGQAAVATSSTCVNPTWYAVPVAA